MGEEAEVEKTEKSSKAADSRWWEYYAVRYALGVGVGTPLVAFLWKSYGGGLDPRTQLTSTLEGTALLLLWAAAGMAYCYIASVPMLTLHATRRLLRSDRRYRLGLFAVTGLSLCGAAAFDRAGIESTKALAWIGAAVLCVLTLIQLALLWNVLEAPDETHDFYAQLGLRRAANADYVESYRHMREHGNSISIVLCELLLAFILWSLRPLASTSKAALVARAGVTLMIWITPASFVWLIGSSLERHLTDSDRFSK